MRITFNENIPTLKQIEEVLRKKPYLNEIASDAENDIIDNLNSEGGNLGARYKKSQRAIHDRDKQGRSTTLVDTEQLRNSIHSVIDVQEPAVFVQSNRMVYKRKKGSTRRTTSDIARIHNEGLEGNLKREFFKFSKGAMNGFIEAIDRSIKT